MTRAKRLVELIDGVGYVPVMPNVIALVDPEDIARVEPIKWSSAFNKQRTRRYVQGYIPMPVGEMRHIARWIMDVEDRHVLVDHINGDPLDNRRANLRLATATQNTWNRVPTSGGSGYKGVWQDGNRWRAAIRSGKKLHHLGSHRTKEEAAIAYDIEAVQRHGEYAWLNHEHFPELLPWLEQRLKRAA